MPSRQARNAIIWRSLLTHALSVAAARVVTRASTRRVPRRRRGTLPKTPVRPVSFRRRWGLCRNYEAVAQALLSNRHRTTTAEPCRAGLCGLVFRGRVVAFGGGPGGAARQLPGSGAQAASERAGLVKRQGSARTALGKAEEQRKVHTVSAVCTVGGPEAGPCAGRWPP